MTQYMWIKVRLFGFLRGPIGSVWVILGEDCVVKEGVIVGSKCWGGL